jgi:hypothetical protein
MYPSPSPYTVFVTFIFLLRLTLIQEGQLVAQHGSHEAVVFNLVPAGGISQAELMKVS